MAAGGRLAAGRGYAVLAVDEDARGNGPAARRLYAAACDALLQATPLRSREEEGGGWGGVKIIHWRWQTR